MDLPRAAAGCCSACAQGRSGAWPDHVAHRTTSEPIARRMDDTWQAPATPPDLIDHVRPASRLPAGQAAGHRRRARPAGEDPLLLLRPAVRHPAQGQGQRGHRLRAVGGLPVQPRDALPEGRQALPAGLAPRPAAPRLRPRPVERPSGFPRRSPTTRRSRASPPRSSASSRRTATTPSPCSAARA